MLIRTLATCGVALLAAVFPAGAANAVSLPVAAKALQSVPAWFEPNAGLHGDTVRYFSRGEGYTLFLEPSGAVLALTDEAVSARMKMELAGGNPKPALEALDPLPGRTDYYLGADRERWKRGTPHYARVRYQDVYPGVSLDYRSSGRRIEYDFFISPGADPSQIRMRFRGATGLRLEGDGTLVVSLGGREVRQAPPYSYQEASGTGASRRVPVAARYELAENGEVRFAVGKYDRSKTLVIDPVLAYAGYFGGDREDVPTGIAVDKDGYVWVTGTTLSAITIPEDTNPYATELKGNRDVFVAKLRFESSGAPTLLYYAYIGGSFDDRGGLIEITDVGRAYITGTTYSSDFPMTSNAAQPTHGGITDAFAAVLDPSQEGKDSLAYSTFLGGTLYDTAAGLYVAADETMYVAGYGASYDVKSIPSGALQPNNRGGYDAMVWHLDPNGSSGEASLLFSTYYGGWTTDVAAGVAADADGNIYLAGYTMSDDFPIEGDLVQGSLRSVCDLFLVKIDPSREGLDRLVYGTYLGGSGLDIATSMRRDKDGDLWITGYTLSPDFPVTAGAFQGAYAGGATDAFLLRFRLGVPSSEAIRYSTYIGGSGADILYDALPLGAGRVAVAGYTSSDDLLLPGAPPAGQTRGQAVDAWVSILDTSIPGIEALQFGTLLGGKLNDVASRMAALPGGAVAIAGYTGSPDLPVTDGSQKGTPGGGSSGFLMRLDPDPVEGGAAPPLLPPGEETGGGAVVRGTRLSVDPQPRRQTR